MALAFSVVVSHGIITRDLSLSVWIQNGKTSISERPYSILPLYNQRFTKKWARVNSEPIRHVPGGMNLYAYRCTYRYKSALRKKSCLTKGICSKPHNLKCSVELRSDSAGWLCVILCVFHCIKIKFTPLQAEEMLFLCQPHILALVFISQTGWVFSHTEIRRFFWSAFDPAELQCRSQRLEPQNHFGNIPCFSRQCLCLCVSLSGCIIFTFEHTVTLSVVLCCHLRKYQSLRLNKLNMPFIKRLCKPNIYHSHSTDGDTGQIRRWAGRKKGLERQEMVAEEPKEAGKRGKEKKGSYLGLKELLNISAYWKLSLSKENPSIDFLVLLPRCRQELLTVLLYLPQWLLDVVLCGKEEQENPLQSCWL